MGAYHTRGVLVGVVPVGDLETQKGYSLETWETQKGYSLATVGHKGVLVGEFRTRS